MQFNCAIFLVFSIAACSFFLSIFLFFIRSSRSILYDSSKIIIHWFSWKILLSASRQLTVRLQWLKKYWNKAQSQSLRRPLSLLAVDRLFILLVPQYFWVLTQIHHWTLQLEFVGQMYVFVELNVMLVWFDYFVISISQFCLVNHVLFSFIIFLRNLSFFWKI